jgi:hypothetical protein
VLDYIYLLSLHEQSNDTLNLVLESLVKLH